MGSDSFQNIKRWKNAEQLLQQYYIFVYKRPGHEIDITITPRLTIMDAPLLEISSTRIREQIKAKKSIRFLVPENVRAEIESNGYYKF